MWQGTRKYLSIICVKAILLSGNIFIGMEINHLSTGGSIKVVKKFKLADIYVILEI